MKTSFKQRATVLLCITAFSTGTLLIGCGGGGGGAGGVVSTDTSTGTGTGTGTGTDITTPVIKPSVAVSTLAADASGYSRKVLDNGKGTQTTYFLDPKTSLPVQAIYKDSAGVQSQIFYSVDGSINKIINLADSSYITVTYDTDSMTVLSFDTTGKFLSGTNLSNTAGVWSTAPVAGALGQISGNASATSTPSQVSTLLLSGSTALGTSTPLNAAAQKLLTPTTTTSRNRWFDMLIPSAHAQNFSSSTNSALRSGIALFVIAGVAGSAGVIGAAVVGPALAVAAGVKIFEGIAGVQKDAAAKLMDDDMTGTAMNDLSSGGTGTTKMSERIKSYLDGKATALKESSNAAINALTNLLSGAKAEPLGIDNVAKSQSLPLVSSPTGTYSSTFVDYAGTVYNGTAKVAIDGSYSGTAASADGATSKFSGTYNSATTAFDGVVSTKDSKGVDVIVDSAAALVKMQADWDASTSIATYLKLSNTSITNAQIRADITLAGSVFPNQDYAKGRINAQTQAINIAQHDLTLTQTKSSAKRTSVGQCRSTTQSGKQGTFASTYNLGISSGSFDISYDMYDIPDAMTVIVGGKQVFSTGGLVSNSGRKTITYTGGSNAIVTLSAPNSGTSWIFSIGCGA